MLWQLGVNVTGSPLLGLALTTHVQGAVLAWGLTAMLLVMVLYPFLIDFLLQGLIQEINDLRLKVNEMDGERLQYEKKLKSTKVSFSGENNDILKHGLRFCEQYYFFKKPVFQLVHGNKFISQLNHDSQ